jgi:hypothetical protein
MTETSLYPVPPITAELEKLKRDLDPLDMKVNP